MSSISKYELIGVLEDIPDYYEIIMEIKSGHDSPAGTSIAYINGARVDNERKIVYLMN